MISNSKRLLAMSALLLAALICSSCGVMDVLGPRDKPDFAKKDWTAITVAYGVNTQITNGLKRTFTVTDRATINDLKSKMNISRIQGLSIGTRDQLLFQERSGKSWHGSIVSKTRIDLSSTEDSWRSYCIEFADDRLVEKLLEICLHNEQTLHPKARPENIVLLEEFLVEAYPGATPESVQARKDMLNAYPKIEE